VLHYAKAIVISDGIFNIASVNKLTFWRAHESTCVRECFLFLWCYHKKY